jgi:hypothetical protein
MEGRGKKTKVFASTEKLFEVFLYAALDDSYEYSMSRHYDEAIGKEVKILSRSSRGRDKFLITCLIVLPFDKHPKQNFNFATSYYWMANTRGKIWSKTKANKKWEKQERGEKPILLFSLAYLSVFLVPQPKTKFEIHPASRFTFSLVAQNLGYKKKRSGKRDSPSFLSFFPPLLSALPVPNGVVVVVFVGGG